MITLRVVRSPTSVSVVRQLGAMGPAGPVGGTTLSKIAAQALSGHRVVKVTSSGQADYASADQLADADLILGVTTGAVVAGDAATIQFADEMVEPSWSWTLGPVFVGLNGLLTQTPPAAAFIRQIGVAVATDRLLIDLRPPLITS